MMDDVNEFYGQRTPLWVHRSDYEFVDPIDWGQMEKDRQEQIDNAYRYIAGGHERCSFSLDKWNIMSSAIQIALPPILKWMFGLIAGAIGVAALDYFQVINLGLF